MSLKGRTRFTVAGTHPLLDLVRDYFIKQGYALVPWDHEERPHFCLIGADLAGSDQMPLAQLELQKMQTEGVRVLLLSAQELAAGSEPVNWEKLGPDFHAGILYARCAEHMFTWRDDTPRPTIVRPVNIYGPDIHCGVVHRAINDSKRGDYLWSPSSRDGVSTFLHQEDFLRYIDIMVRENIVGTYNVASTEPSSYQNLLRNIWKFTNGPDAEPIIQCSNCPMTSFIPDTGSLELMSYKPKTTLRSQLYKMIQS